MTENNGNNENRRRESILGPGLGIQMPEFSTPDFRLNIGNPLSGMFNKKGE